MSNNTTGAIAADGLRRFDAIIIGAGQAGPSLAGRLNAAGMTVAIIERDKVGGTCVNTGCKQPRPWWPMPTPHIWHGAARTTVSPGERS